MNRTERLYAIVEELRHAGDQGRSSTWLARRLEVAPRTIKRDVTALQEAGVPIWANPGRGGGYVLDPRATLPPMTFTADEAIAVALALAVQPGLPFEPEAQAALTKLLGALHPDDRAAAQDLAARVFVNAPAEPRPRVARTLDQALAAQVVVVLDYVDADGQRTERRPVEPVAYAFDEGRWYLLAWCRRRRAERWFRLDRVAEARLTTEPYEPRDVEATFGTPPDGAGPIDLG